MIVYRLIRKDVSFGEYTVQDIDANESEVGVTAQENLALPCSEDIETHGLVAPLNCPIIYLLLIVLFCLLPMLGFRRQVT
jgi:hypothetical protein